MTLLLKLVTKTMLLSLFEVQSSVGNTMKKHGLVESNKIINMIYQLFPCCCGFLLISLHVVNVYALVNRAPEAYGNCHISLSLSLSLSACVCVCVCACKCVCLLFCSMLFSMTTMN